MHTHQAQQNGFFAKTLQQLRGGGAHPAPWSLRTGIQGPEREPSHSPPHPVLSLRMCGATPLLPIRATSSSYLTSTLCVLQLTVCTHHRAVSTLPPGSSARVAGEMSGSPLSPEVRLTIHTGGPEACTVSGLARVRHLSFVRVGRKDLHRFMLRPH
jgi:hypothetical protein